MKIKAVVFYAVMNTLSVFCAMETVDKRSKDPTSKSNQNTVSIKPNDVNENDNNATETPPISNSEFEEAATKEINEPNEDKRWHFGGILGNGLFAGKRDHEDIIGTKRFAFGNIFGHGFVTGKRHSQLTDKDVMSKRYFGSVLGKGFMAGKRNIADDIAEVDVGGSIDDMDKKWIGDVFGTGYHYKRSKRDAKESRTKRYIHYFGKHKMLGRGFVLGKRQTNNDDAKQYLYDDDDLIKTIDSEEPILVYNPDDEDNDDYEHTTTDDDSSTDSSMETIDSDKRYFDSAPGYRFMLGKRYNSGDDATEEETHESDKRYFNSDFGSRFMFGKRGHEINSKSDRTKRFGHIIGHGFTFGKRRPYGHVLGNGFSFGKRTSDMLTIDEDRTPFNSAVVPQAEDSHKLDKRYGWLLGRGFSTGKRDNRKRFGWVLGNGLKFGKRSDGMDTDDFEDYYFVDDEGNIADIGKRGGYSRKRFGHVLGSGFSFGKRDGNMVYGDSDFPEKRGVGFLLGRGFRGFGKRGSSYKRFGSILGSGFAFGKRNSDLNNEYFYPGSDLSGLNIDDTR